MRRLVPIAAVLLALGWLAASALFCEVALRVPRHRIPGASNEVPPGAVSRQEVAILAADGVRLRGSFLPAADARRGCVLLLHGVADSRRGAAGFARMFAAAGYSVLAIDSRGHGASGGETVTYGLLERADVLRWAAWLRARGCQAVYGLGESMGAAILIQAAAEQPVFAAIAAECPFADLRSIAKERVVQVTRGPMWLRRRLASVVVPAAFEYARLRYGYDLDKVSPVAAAARLKTPVLLIHGLSDTNIPPSHSRAIAAAGGTTSLWLVPGAGHTGAAAAVPHEFNAKVLGWFELHRPGRLSSGCRKAG